MKNIFKYHLFLISILSLVIIGCDDEVVYNNLKVNDFEIVEANHEQVIPIAIGSTQAVRIKLLPVASIDKSNYQRFTYSSSDESIFTVNGEGIITGVKRGEATLTVQSVSNKNLAKTYTIRILPNLVTSIELPLDYQNYKMVVGDVLDFKEIINVLPATADDLTVTYTSSDNSIASITDNGILTAKSAGSVDIVIEAADGGGASAICSINIASELTGDFPRTKWTITTSHEFTPDGSTGAPEDMLDDNFNTFLSIKKPGKAEHIPIGSILHFTIDLNATYPFDYFRWGHRGNNTISGLRVSEVELQGSNNGVDFDILETGLAIDISSSVKEYTVNLQQSYSYRYVRFIITGYLASPSSAVQISEINIGKKEANENR